MYLLRSKTMKALKDRLLQFITISKLWSFATVICALFYPLGILLICALVIYEANHPEKVDLHIFLCGLALFMYALFQNALFIFLMIYANSFSWSILMAVLPCLLIAIAIIFLYLWLNQFKQLYQGVYQLIQKNHIISLNKIASILKVEDAKLKKIIQLLIKNDCLQNARIDEQHQEIVLEKSMWAKQFVMCENCGASMVVNFGATLTCEYCGSALRVKKITTNSNEYI